MLDPLTDLMETARGRCSYAEARHVARNEEQALVRDGQIDRVDASVTDGVGVRVHFGGS